MTTGYLRLPLLLCVVIGAASVAATASPKQGTRDVYSLRILDEARPTQSALGIDDLTDPNFKEFVTAVSDHIAATLRGRQAQAGAAHGDPDVTLLFIRRPLVKQNVTAQDLSLDGIARRGARAVVESPWVRIEISGEPRPTISASFLWNERQVLLDQALLGGAPVPRDRVLTSIEPDVLARYAQDYAQSVILVSDPAQAAAALSELATRIPPDIFWLYTHSVQSTRADFSVFAVAALEATLAQARRGYQEIAVALFDRSLDSAATGSGKYDTVLDLSGIVNLEQYRANPLR